MTKLKKQLNASNEKALDARSVKDYKSHSPVEASTLWRTLELASAANFGVWTS